MAVPGPPPSRGSSDAAESSAAAAAALPPSGATCRSPVLTLCSASDPICVQEQDHAKAGDEAPGSATAAAAGEFSPSLLPLMLSSVSVSAQDLTVAAPPSSSNLGAMDAEARAVPRTENESIGEKEDPLESTAEPRSEKRAASPTEYELVAARLRRRRTPAPAVVAAEAPVASSTKPSPSAALNEETPAANRNPNISAAAASNDLSNLKKLDQLGIGGEPNATNSSGSSARGATVEAAAAGSGGYQIGSVQSYRRIRVLGQGGCGTVWKARDTRTGELVAIKSCNDSDKRKRNEGDGAAALLREAALLAACRGNPAVVGFREVIRGPAADEVHLVMDLGGPSLRDLLYKRGQFTESETRDTMRQLLVGLEKMGCQGIVHGDLKPENLLVSRSDGRLMICDFGLAVSVAAPPCHLEGTFWYSAPEQLLGEKNCGPAVDAWAIGYIMAELLTGKLLLQTGHATQQWIKTIFMLGVPDQVSQTSLGVDASTRSELRSRVPVDLLTPAGFDVLEGFIQYEAHKRLTPAAALKMPWFAEEQQSKAN